jgi:translation initiation factor eIF-2B subunit delta
MNQAWARVERAAADADSGAAQIARKAGAALALLPSGRIPDAVELLVRGHPSMAPLWRLANEVLSASDPAEGARSFLAMLDGDEGAASVAAAILPDRILTLSYSSSVVAAIRLRRPQQTVCMRSEPGGEGWRVAEETRDRTWSVVMEDEEALERLPGDAVVVGADAVTPQGVVNKVKTHRLAEAARSKDIPRYVVAGHTKFLGRALPLGAAFETTPLELITAVAAPGGLLGPKEARRRADDVGLSPRLTRLLEELGDPQAKS